MGTGAKKSNLISFEEALAKKRSPLEKEYLDLYGEEFVDDLKQAFRWMRKDMRSQPPQEQIVRFRKENGHEFGDWVSVFYVDFAHEDFYSQTIDNFGKKTIENRGHSPCLRARDKRNIRYLLSGLYFYDRTKTRKWLNEFLGEGEKFWAEKA